MMGSSRQPSCLHHARSPAERHGGRVDGAGAGQYHLARTGKRAMDVDARGWLTAARRQPSANFNQRPRGVALDLLVVHGISLPPGRFGGPAIEELFTSRLDCSDPLLASLEGVRVSAHFLIRRDGELVQFVSCLGRAWHAGASSFQGREGCNDYSVGIELEGTDWQPYSAAQYRRLAARSEEHTSELQSRGHLVCRLLLEI